MLYWINRIFLVALKNKKIILNKKMLLID